MNMDYNTYGGFNNIDFKNTTLSYSDEKPKAIYEMCDVCCGCGDAEQMLRSTFYSKNGTRFVIRHHPFCNSALYFEQININLG